MFANIQIKKAKKRFAKNNYYLIYSIFFVITCLLVLSFFYLNGKSLVWKNDALNQHLNALVYWGQYLRNIVRTFFETGKLTLPMWDFNIGYGSDIFTTLYFIVGDPLSYLAAITPTAYMLHLYNFLILFRLFLAGIMFSVYCRRMKLKNFPVLIGSLIYVFCGWSMVALKHPYFLTPLILLPLILLGIEKVFVKQSPKLFIIMIFLSAINNFYFFYMLSIFMFIYAVFRYVMIYKKVKFRNVILTIWHFLKYYLIGLLMSAFIMLPVAIAFFNTARIEANNEIPLFYNLPYYQKFISGFISGMPIGEWNLMGYTPIALIVIVLLFTDLKKNRYLITGHVILLTFLLMPEFGHIFNGFSYVTNRFVWGYSFLMSLTIAIKLPELFSLSKKKLKIIIISTLIYCMLCFFIKNIRNVTTFSVCVILLVCVCLLLMYTNRQMKGYRIFEICLLSLVIISLYVNSYYRYSPEENNYLKEFRDQDKVLYAIQNSGTKAATKIDDPTFWRIEENPNGQSVRLNATMQNKLNGTSYSFSLANGKNYLYRKEVIQDDDEDLKYFGLDGRVMPEALASVKYFIIKRGNEQYLPHTFSEKVASSIGSETSSTDMRKVRYDVYKSKFSLPFGYTYDKAISYKDYYLLNPVQKQQAMMQAVVLNTTSKKTDVNKLEYLDEEVKYSINIEGGASIHNNNVIVRDTDAIMKINFDGGENCENYISFENLKFEGRNPLEFYNNIMLNQMPVLEKNTFKNKYRYWEGPDLSAINIESDGVKKELELYTPRYSWYMGQKDYISNLGYSKSGKKEIKIKFRHTGIYSFENLKVISQPLNSLEEYINDLKQNSLKDLSFSSNKIKGNITLDQDKILCLSMPYSKGWSANIDGKEKTLKEANTMYSALELSEGTHTIELRYRTPGLLLGTALTCIGIGLFIIVHVVRRRDEKNEKN